MLLDRIVRIFRALLLEVEDECPMLLPDQCSNSNVEHVIAAGWFSSSHTRVTITLLKRIPRNKSLQFFASIGDTS
jgi:hypothetical protein